MLLSKHALPIMIAGGGGSLIHSASGFGLLGEMTLTSYGASKAALINLSRFLATQYGKQGIRSNAIAIGFVLSETAEATTPQAVKDILLDHHLNPELGSPRDIANVVACLASDESRFINGALIPRACFLRADVQSVTIGPQVDVDLGELHHESWQSTP